MVFPPIVGFSGKGYSKRKCREKNSVRKIAMQTSVERHDFLLGRESKWIDM
jgi:hypothetical protein